MEGRVRALTREVGSLREELKREVKRRERAVERCKECEASAEAAEEQLRELRYSNRKLSEDLVSTQESAKQTAETNSRAITALKEGLAKVEQAVGQRASKSYEKMQSVYSMVQKLQTSLFTPGNIRESAASEAQSLFAELLQQLSQLSGHLANGTDGLASLLASSGLVGSGGTGAGEDVKSWRHQPHPSSSVSAASPRHVEVVGQLRAENDMLKAQLGNLQGQLSAAADSMSANPSLVAAVSQVEGLIPHYRQALSKLKMQAIAMKDRLEHASREKQVLSDEVTQLEQAVRERDDALRRWEAQEAEVSTLVQRREADMAAVSTEAESMRLRIEEELRRSRERCSELESVYSSACREYSAKIQDLQAKLAEEQRKYEQQCVVTSDLQALIGDQESDIRKALDLVTTFRPAHNGRSISNGGGASDAAAPTTSHSPPHLPLPANGYGADYGYGYTHKAAPTQPSRPFSAERNVASQSQPSVIANGSSQPRRFSSPQPPYSSSSHRQKQSPKIPFPSMALSHVAPSKPLSQGSISEATRYATGGPSQRVGQAAAFGSFDMGRMRSEMAALDSEIAGLEDSLREAATKFAF